ncbi:hypothetical protein LTS01_026185, partial [Friedmanniomyces endolithicus]
RLRARARSLLRMALRMTLSRKTKSARRCNPATSWRRASSTSSRVVASTPTIQKPSKISSEAS